MNARRLALALAAALAVAACGDDGPQPGTLVVQLTGAAPARAVKFRLVGPSMAVLEPGTGAVVSAQPLGGDTMMVASFVPVGATLNGTAVAAISVPDVGAVALYSATVLEVAAPSYALQKASQYTLTIVRQ
jgi:hypothetical protein